MGYIFSTDGRVCQGILKNDFEAKYVNDCEGIV